MTNETTTSELNEILDRAVTAQRGWQALPLDERARAMCAAANALDEHSTELIEIAERETGLPNARLTGEVKRTSTQLRLFADVVRAGGFLEVREDDADPDFVLGARPELRRMLVPLGVCLNFAASNFPFAFSVAGGDSASALAAGCSVVVKAHPGHIELSRRTAEVVAEALESAGAPKGVFALIIGDDAGIAALEDDRVAVATFTGSVRIGRMLADRAAARRRPIPFYGELGSVNPVFVTDAALEERSAEIALGLATAVAGSAGQLCTKPGFVWLPERRVDDFAAAVRSALDVGAEQRMLYPRVGEGYASRRDAIMQTPGVEVVVEGAVRTDDDGQAWVTPTVVRVSAETLAANAETLADEAFGPLTVLVETPSGTAFADAVRANYEGSLTGTVHLADGEGGDELVALVDELSRTCGRVLFNGWPTGVSVTPAMTHGGPYPATTNDLSTSVGTAAIRRFLRSVTFQGAPTNLLPSVLTEDAGVPVEHAPAGESANWGRSA